MALVTCASVAFVLLAKPKFVTDQTTKSARILFDSAMPESAKPVVLSFPAYSGKTEFDASLAFKVYSFSNGYPNILQTANANEGLRLELTPEHRLSLVTHYESDKGWKGYPLCDTVPINTWVTMNLRARSGHGIEVWLNTKPVLTERDPKITFSMDKPVLGQGFDESRIWNGAVELFEAKYSKLKVPSFSKRIISTFFLFLGLLLVFALLSACLIRGVKWLRELIHDSNILLIDGFQKLRQNQLVIILGDLLLSLSRILYCLWPYIVIVWIPLLIGIVFLTTKTNIYPDELGYQLVNARVGYDGFFYSAYCGTFPMCTSARAIPMPLAWYPAQFFYWAIYAPVIDMRIFRYIGVFIAVMSMGGAAWLASKAASIKLGKTALVPLFCVSITLMGILPFVAVMSRPETPLALVLAYLIFSPFIAKDCNTPVGKVLILSGTAIALMFFLATHPKAIFFAPVALISVWAIVCRYFGRKWAAAATFVTLLLVLQSYTVFTRSARCPESSRVATIQTAQSMVPSKDTLLHPSPFIKTALLNITGIRHYLTQNLFQRQYPISWFPPVRESDWALAKKINFALSWYFGLLLLLPFGCITMQLFGGKTTIFGENGENLIPMALVFCLLVQSIMQISKHFYEATLIMPAIAYLCVVAFISAPVRERGRSCLRLACSLGIILASFSMLCALIFFSGRVLAGYEGGLMMGNYNHEFVVRNMEGIRQTCGFKSGSSLKHLVLDDLAYMHFKKEYQPYNGAYVAISMYADDPVKSADPVYHLEQLKKFGIDGIIHRCAYMSMVPPWNIKTRRFDDMCCENAADIDSALALSRSKAETAKNAQ